MTTEPQRTFLNSILTFIGATSLTDAEAATINLQGTFYDGDSFAALLNVLSSREGVSSKVDRLRYFFASKGVTVALTTEPKTTNIFFGAVLGDDCE